MRCLHGGKVRSTTGNSACTDCAGGKHASGTGSISCTQCLSGKATADTGQQECAACGVGKHQLAPGQTACSDCAGGYVADSSGLPTCSICNGGKYANVEKSACMDCIVGTFSSAGSSLADSCSVYPANSFSQLAPRATMASSPQGVRQPITVILCCCCERKSLISNKQNI